MKRMKNCFAAVAFFSVLLAVTEVFAENSTCADAYNGVMANIDTGQRVRIENSTAYRNYCSASGQVNKQNISGSLSATIKAIPFTAALNYGSDDEKMDQFCKTGFDQNGFFSSDLWYAKTVSDAAQRNFNQCRKLETAGLSLTHVYTPPRFIVLQGHYLDNYSQATLDRLSYDPTRVTCSSNSFGHGVFGNGPKIINSKTGRLTADGDFTVQCERIATKYKDKDLYPDVQIVASFTKAGVNTPYEITAPEDTNLGPTLSSDAQTQIDLLKRQVIDLSAQRTALTTERDGYSKRLADSHVVLTKTIYIGEYGQAADNLAGRYYCYTDPNQVAASTCPAGTTVQLHNISHWEGNKCGYGAYEITCLQK